MEEGRGIEPPGTYSRRGFQDRLSPWMLPSKTLAGALRFELRTSGLESDVLPLDTMLPQKTWCIRMDSNHRRALAQEVYSLPRLPLCHVCKESQLSKIKIEQDCDSACGMHPLLILDYSCFVLEIQERESAPATLGLIGF